MKKRQTFFDKLRKMQHYFLTQREYSDGCDDMEFDILDSFELTKEEKIFLVQQMNFFNHGEYTDEYGKEAVEKDFFDMPDFSFKYSIFRFLNG